MPSFLPLKMHVFLCGMLIANGLFVMPRQTVMNGLLAVMLVMIPIGGDITSTKVAVRLLLVVGFFALVHYHLLPGLVGKLGDRISSLMGNHFCHWPMRWHISASPASRGRARRLGARCWK
jgi:hypothetical protein